MKGFDLMAILLNPEFSAMLLHGLQMTLVIAVGSWLLAMTLAVVAADGSPHAEPHRRACRRGLRLLPPQRADAGADHAVVLRHLEPAARRRARLAVRAQRRSAVRDHRAGPVPGGLLQRGPALGPALDSARARPRRRAPSATASSARCATCCMPQAIRNAVPALVNHSVSLFKNSSLAMAIGAAELTHAVKEVESQSFRAFEAYLMATVAVPGHLAADHGRRRLAGQALQHRRGEVSHDRHRSKSCATTGCCC